MWIQPKLATFALAQKNTLCIHFIDEMDAVGREGESLEDKECIQSVPSKKMYLIQLLM